MATNNKQLKVPFFAKGTANSLDAALSSGVFSSLDRVAFVFLMDRLEWVMIDTNKSVYTLRGFTEDAVKKYVQRVSALPQAADASTDAMYIVGNTVYTFDGEYYHSTYSPLETVVDNLQQEVQDLQQDLQQNYATKDMVGALPDGMSIIDFVNTAAMQAVDSAWQYTDEQLEVHIVPDD